MTISLIETVGLILLTELNLKSPSASQRSAQAIHTSQSNKTRRSDLLPAPKHRQCSTSIQGVESDRPSLVIHCEFVLTFAAQINTTSNYDNDGSNKTTLAS